MNTSGAQKESNQKHWFFGPLLRQKGKLIQLIIASICINLFALLSAFYIMTVYDRVIPNEGTESLFFLTGGMLVVIFFDFLMKVVRGVITDNVGVNVDEEVADNIFEHINRNETLIGNQSVGSMANTVKEFDSLREFMASATLVAFADFPFLLVFLYVLYLIGGPIAAVPAIIVILVLLIGLALQPLIKKSSEGAITDGKSKQSVLIEMLNGLETLKSLRGINLIKERWSQSVTQQGLKMLRSRFWSQLTSNFAQTGQQLSQIGIVVYGVFLIMTADLTMGALIACVILSGRTLAPLGQMSNLLGRFNHALASYKNLEKLFGTKSSEKMRMLNLRKSELEGNLIFTNVTISHESAKRPALDNVNLNINSGERVAILGKIGSGKSTLLKLASGLNFPTSGTVQAGDTDLSHLHPEDLRNNISICLQSPTLFSGSIKDNLLLGNPTADDDEVVKIAKITGADSIANDLPNGFLSEIGEGGLQLSGGQRQALFISRTIISNPKILLMDEPTSAMDNVTENMFLERFKKWLGTRTFVVATHRGKILDLVERIIVLDNGRIVADGPKDKVLQKAKKK